MKTFISYLLDVIFGVVALGCAIAIGVLLIVGVVCLIEKLEKKFRPAKTRDTSIGFCDALLSSSGNNCIFISNTLLSKIDIANSIKELRADFWGKDIVIPEIKIQLIPFFMIEMIKEHNLDFNCFIKLEGKEIFKGKIEENQDSTALNEAIVSEIEQYFSKKDKSLEDRTK